MNWISSSWSHGRKWAANSFSEQRWLKWASSAGMLMTYTERYVQIKMNLHTYIGWCKLMALWADRDRTCDEYDSLDIHWEKDNKKHDLYIVLLRRGGRYLSIREKSHNSFLYIYFSQSIGLADAVYESGWYKSNIRCRRALLLLLQRYKIFRFLKFNFPRTLLVYSHHFITIMFRSLCFVYTMSYNIT